MSSSNAGDPPPAGLAQRLSEAEATIRALLSGQVDAVVDPRSETPLLLAKAQEALREGEKRLQASLEEFRTLAEAMPQIVWTTRPDGWNTYFNRQWMDYTGLSLEESRGHGWIRPFHPDDQQRAWEAWQEATASGDTYSVECRLRRADGVYRWWLLRGVPAKDARGQILKWFGTCTDVHSLKLAEQEVTRTNRALRMLSSCNEALIRAESESGLLDSICRVAVEEGGYRMVWVGFVEDDEQRSITPQAHAGVDEAYLSETRVTWNEADPLGQGPGGRTVRRGKAVVCEDLERDPTMTPWLDQARPRGYRGLICLPLREAARVVGLLTLYSGEVKETGPGELELLQQMADDVAFGIGNLRARTEQRRLEEERRRSDERFQAIFRASPTAIGISRGGTILEANDRYCEFFGYARSELVGQSAHDLEFWVDPEDRARMLAGVRAEGAVRDFATRFRRKDGSVRDALLAAEPFEDGATAHDGPEPPLLVAVVDVTGIKLVEAELRESRSFLEQAQTVGHLGSWVSDPDEKGGSLTWSDETRRIFGFDGEAFDGRVETFFSLVHPDDLPAVRAASTAALVHGEPYAIDHRIVRPDGSVRVVHEAAEVVRDAAGRPSRMVGVVQDITESRAAEERIRDNEERYRILFDESPMPMWAYDPESLRIVMANQAAALQYGYTAEELCALTLPDVRPPGVDAEGIRDVNRAMPPGRQSTGTWEHQRKDGSHLHVDVHLTDVRLGGRRLKLAVLHDVTDRRSLEEQLRQSQKMEAVGRLAGGVAHDFNNLLTVILGYGDLLGRRFEIGDEERAEVHEICRAAERAAALTRQLLAFSRKQVLVPETLDLGEVVGGAVKMLDRLIGEDVSLELAVASDLGRVLADPGQVEQVVMNLAVNARDAMPRGGEILIDLRNVELDEAFVRQHIGTAPGPYVRLAMKDTGVGMPPEVQKQVFEPFFTTKAVGEGTGLGLSTVFGIVNQSGGTIWVESQVGQGTTFSIYLPRIAGAVATAAESGTHPVLEGTGTILLVEDEEQLRRLARAVLEPKGYTVLQAGSGAEALRVAREHPGPIDLLLTDVVMPGMSGSDLAASLETERPGVLVLYMSGYTTDAIVRHGILNSGVQFLQKPFTPRGLAERVHEVLFERRKAHGS